RSRRPPGTTVAEYCVLPCHRSPLPVSLTADVVGSTDRPEDRTIASRKIREDRSAISDGPGHRDLISLLAKHGWKMLRGDRAAVPQLVQQRDGRVRPHLTGSRKNLVHLAVGVDDHVADVDHERAIDEARQDHADVVAGHRHTPEAE